MRIIIFANGVIENPAAEAARWVRSGDCVVAADGGTAHALAAGLMPAHIIGDLDSLLSGQRPDLQQQLEAAGTILHAYPPAKDETDLELALMWAGMQLDIAQIVILGALGGRPDQVLANLLLLALPVLAGREVAIADGAWAIRCLRGGEMATFHGHPGDTLSLLPLGGDAAGVTTHGLRYPLHDETLFFGQARGVSNEFTDATATVSLKSGLLWCFHQNIG
ncbi:MAG: thiamine diphosphokinase [Anaerolineae bacterium]|nr:thiamine diphosphokinase [Anaerolineae bacterium]